MVKKPEPAPANVAESDAFHSLLRMLNEGALASIIQRANEEYLYWDKVKYLELPEEGDVARSESSPSAESSLNSDNRPPRP